MSRFPTPDGFDPSVLVGRTIVAAEMSGIDNEDADGDRLSLTLDDGSRVDFETRDAESYQSWFEVTRTPA